MSILQIAFILFALVAAGGVLMAGLIAGKVQFPAFLAPAHGLAGLGALCVLFAANIMGDATPTHAWWAFAVFFAGFLGGVLFFRVLFRDRVPPLLLVAGHGSLAVVGLYLLYGVAF